MEKRDLCSRRELVISGLKVATALPAVMVLAGRSAEALAKTTHKAKHETKNTHAKEASNKGKAAGGTITEDKLVKADNPVAKALKYDADASASPDRKAAPAKMGVPAAEQHCANCQFFTEKGKLANGDVAGQCTMIQGGFVKAKGWCTSWTKKA